MPNPGVWGLKHERSRRNLFEVERVGRPRFPRVTRCSQPGALLQNPFGIPARFWLNEVARVGRPRFPRVGSLLATLGFIAESLWDSRSLASIKTGCLQQRVP